MTRSINELADYYLTQLVELDPIFGTELGTGDDPAGLPDYSADGNAARADLDRATLNEAEATPATAGEIISKQLMIERLGARLAIHDAGEWMADINVISSPQHQIKQAIDLMPRNTKEDWETIAQRLLKVSGALEGYKQSLRLGLNNGHTASKRQVAEAARLARRTVRRGAPHTSMNSSPPKTAATQGLATFLRTLAKRQRLPT